MTRTTVAVIQARMGSSRLPGKVLLPLDREHVLTHVVRRVDRADAVDETVVATSTEQSDDIVEWFGREHDVPVHRGSESDVSERMYEAARKHDADNVVRVTGDCPLIHPDTIDAVVSALQGDEVDYASNTISRTFPRGLDVEAFTMESFEQVRREGSQKRHREHVTPYYRENPDVFELTNVTSDTVFDDPRFEERADLRLTLDEADDYRVIREIYENLSYDAIVPIRDAIRYVDRHDLMEMNRSVSQKEL